MGTLTVVGSEVETPQRPQPVAKDSESARQLSSSTVHTFRSFDGTDLFYRAWLPDGAVRGALILLHRGHEHSGRLADLVRDLGLLDEGIAAFAWDARGHGRSPGERGYAPSFGAIVRDLDAFAATVAQRHGIPTHDTIVLGHSVGAVVAAAWVHDYAPPLRGLVLATPALRVKLYVPLARPALRLRERLRAMRGRGTSFIKSYVKAGMLTHDAARAADYAADPLVARSIATNILLGLHDASTRLLADAAAIRVRTLVLSAGSDWVVKNRPQAQFFERLSSPHKRMQLLSGLHHSIFDETDRATAINEARRLVLEAFERPAATVAESSLLEADRAGYTKGEHDRLARPRPMWCARRWSFAAQRLSMKTLGRLSDGIRIGWRSGFDSGESLDYVYENRPRGFTPLGRLIDRTYLNAVGWRGIRQRKMHLEAALRAAIIEAHERLAGSRPVRVLDIAAGPGRYLLDVLRALPPGVQARAELRDQSEAALAAGRKLAAELGLSSTVTYVSGDAFSFEAVAATEPQPDVAVVSGLYELFPDNAPVQDSLRALATALPVGTGRLIYTNQPWHPQVEMIARVLTNRDGKPWVMRRRTQAEMDALVAAAGFVKESMRIDEDGIFTVSVARRAE